MERWESWDYDISEASLDYDPHRNEDEAEDDEIIIMNASQGSLHGRHKPIRNLSSFFEEEDSRHLFAASMFTIETDDTSVDSNGTIQMSNRRKKTERRECPRNDVDTSTSHTSSNNVVNVVNKGPKSEEETPALQVHVKHEEIRLAHREKSASDDHVYLSHKHKIRKKQWYRRMSLPWAATPPVEFKDRSNGWARAA